MNEPTPAELTTWLHEWEAGRSKNEIERTELEDPSSHGKRITALWRNELGVETEAVHPLAAENERLRGLLDEHGIDR